MKLRERIQIAAAAFGIGGRAGSPSTPSPERAEPARPTENVPPALARIIRREAGSRWLMPSLAALTPQYIEQVLRSAMFGDHGRQWELFDLMLDTWPELAACAQELTDGVSCLKMVFEPFCEEDEEATPSAIERQKLVSSALRRMAPEAAADENDLEGTLADIIDGWFRGVTALETEWQTITSGIHGTILAPRCTFWVHPKHFGFDSTNRLGLRIDDRGQLADATTTLGYNAQPGANIAAFPPHKFLVGIHKAKSGQALGGALLRPLAWWWCAANFSADWLLNLAQIFGLPFRWANYDPTAPQETVDRICSMLQNMGSAGWAAFPAGTTLELKDAGKTGDHSPQGELLDRADRYARLLILGQTQSGGKGSAVGGQAFGAVESDVKKKRIEAAGRYACRVFNTQLIPSILTLNYGDADECPKMRLLEDEEGGYEEAQRDEILSRIMPLSKSFLRKKYGQPEPQDEEDAAGGAPEPEETSPQKGAKGAKKEEPVKAGEGEGHPFRGNQFTGGRGEGTHKPPRRISDADADRLLLQGLDETDAEGAKVHFGERLKTKLESKPEYAGRKELLHWARETVRTGKKERSDEYGEERDYYGKFFADEGAEKGMMVIVSVKDGEAFNMFRAPRKYLRSKGLAARDGGERDEPGEQPPVAVLRAIAAAGGSPDWFHDTAPAAAVNQLAEICAIEDDAVFAKALEEFANELEGYDASEARDEKGRFTISRVTTPGGSEMEDVTFTQGEHVRVSFPSGGGTAGRIAHISHVSKTVRLEGDEQRHAFGTVYKTEQPKVPKRKGVITTTEALDRVNRKGDPESELTDAHAVPAEFQNYRSPAPKKKK